MASFFQRVKEGIRHATTPLDELDKHFIASVEKATSDVLIAPDWAMNLEIVDQINNNPTVCSDKVCYAVRRTLISNNPRVQNLTLTLLETIVKNADSRFHEHFADSELFEEMQIMADPQPSSRKVHAEVRDRILTLIENLGKAVKHVPYFSDVYEGMLDKGIDFPVRAPDDDLPFTVRPPAPRLTQPRPGGIDPDALAALSEEDRRAIQQAMLELDQQAHQPPPVDASQQTTAHTAPPPLYAPPPLAAQPGAYPPPPVSHQPPAYQQPGTGYSPPGVVYAPPTAAAAYPPQSAGPIYGQPQSTPEEPPAPADPQEVKNMLEVVKNSRELLTEMLLSLPADDLNAVREPYITELAGQVKRMKSQLESAIHTATDEVLLSGAISEHEEVQRVLHQYEEALARAAPHAPAPAVAESEPEGVPPAVQPSHLFSGAPIYPGAQFSISDDEVDSTLQTRRGAATVPPVLPPPPAPQNPISPHLSLSTPAVPQQDMISLDSPVKAAAPAAVSSPPPVHAESASDDALVQQLDRLVMQDKDDDDKP